MTVPPFQWSPIEDLPENWESLRSQSLKNLVLVWKKRSQSLKNLVLVWKERSQQLQGSSVLERFKDSLRQ
jgi:gas vesicle protein